MKLEGKLREEFSMGGKITIESFYIQPSQSRSVLTYTNEQIESYVDKIKRKQGLYYKETDEWLYRALKENDIKGKKVIVVGSEQPWYETIAWVYSGEHCTCLEYNKRICESENFKYVQYDMYDSLPEFDVGISISSIEHSGLGRYGDQIDSMGDIKAMQQMKRLLKKDGLLFLAVPVGADRVMWNAHRVYGDIRLKLLIEGWECLAKYGFSENLMRTNANSYNTIQPVFVLKNIK